MKILRRAGGAVEHIWASYPFIGIMVLFIAIGFGVYQGSKAKVYAKQSVAISKQNGITIEQLRKTQQDALAEKDRRIAEKDLNIQNLTTVVGQIYNAALALQQQVITLGGKPKVIPVTIPTKTSLTPSSNPAASSVQTTVTTTTTVMPPECKLGLSAAPLNIIGVNLCIPPPKG